MLWVLFACLTGGAVFSVLWPLSRAPADLDARELDVAFYKAQTAEIERDAARGVIGEEEAEGARSEAARRLMSASQRASRDLERASPWGIRIVAFAAMLFVPALALGLYWQIGAPNMRDLPLQARLDAAPANMDMATAIAKIEQHLAKEPSDGRGWGVLAPIYVRMQRYDDAQRAYNNAIRYLGPTADRYAALGDAQVNAASGTVSDDAKRSFEEAVKLDPKSPRANFYLGLAAEQDGDKSKALAIWRKLVADSPPGAPWLPMINNRIADASGEAPPADASAQAEAPQAGSPQAGAPQAGVPQGDKAAAVAALPKDQQQAMIHRMVDGLAERLKSNGNDIDGWLRLVRAYRVLNEGDKASAALTNARRNFAADPDAKKRLDALAHELGLEG